MPINPNIPLSVQAPQVQDPMQSYGQMMTLRDLMKQGQVRDLQMDRLRRETQLQEEEDRKRKTIKAIRSKNVTVADGNIKINHKGITSGLAKAGFVDEAQAYETALTQAQQEAQKLSHEQWEQEVAKNDRFDEAITTLLETGPQDRPAVYNHIRGKFEREGMDLSHLPAQWSEDMLPKLESDRFALMTAKEVLEANKPKGPEDTQAALGLAAQTMGPAQNQQQWTSRRKFLTGKVSADVLGLIPEEFSEEARQGVARLGLTPEQQRPEDPSIAEQDRSLAMDLFRVNHGIPEGRELTSPQRTQALREFDIASKAPKEESEITANKEVDLTLRIGSIWSRKKSGLDEIKRQTKIMRAGLEAARQGNMAAGSQAVLVTFQKILDPISVVRESEYARSSAGMSLINRIKGGFEKLATGGAGVPLSELENFANLAQEFDKKSSESIQGERGRIERLADRWGLDRSLIFDDAGMESRTPNAETLRKKYNY